MGRFVGQLFDGVGKGRGSSDWEGGRFRDLVGWLVRGERGGRLGGAFRLEEARNVFVGQEGLLRGQRLRCRLVEAVAVGGDRKMVWVGLWNVVG